MIRNIKNILQKHWVIISILIVFSFLFFARLGRDLFLDWDECIYIQWAKEMFQSRKFLTNHWMGKIAFEKPPFNSWLLQIPFFFGINEFTARIPSVVSGILLFVVIYIFCVKFFSKQIAVFSVLFLAISQIFSAYIVKLNTDLPYMLFIFCAFITWVFSEKKSWYGYISGFFFGIAVLTKGLSVLPFMGALFFAIFADYKKQRLFDYSKLLLAFFIVILPWHIYNYMVFGKQFIQQYFWEQFILRAVKPIEFHFEGRLFYAKLLYANYFPWIFLFSVIPFVVFPYLRRIFNKHFLLINLQKNKLFISIVLLIIIPLFSITNAKTRIAWYILPVLPFFAIYLAYSVNMLAQKIKYVPLAVIVSIILCVQSIVAINKEVQLNRKERVISPRNDIFLKSKNYQNNTIQYLAWKPERIAEAILPKDLRTSRTFIYGGTPCATYYSGKTIIPYFSTEEFEKQINQKKGLFVIENGDKDILKNKPITILHRNTDYTLFRN